MIALQIIYIITGFIIIFLAILISRGRLDLINGIGDVNKLNDNQKRYYIKMSVIALSIMAFGFISCAILVSIFTEHQNLIIILDSFVPSFISIILFIIMMIKGKNMK